MLPTIAAAGVVSTFLYQMARDEVRREQVQEIEQKRKWERACKGESERVQRWKQEVAGTLTQEELMNLTGYESWREQEIGRQLTQAGGSSYPNG